MPEFKAGVAGEPVVKQAVFPELSGQKVLEHLKTGLLHLLDIDEEITVEVGRTSLRVKEVLGLDNGSIIKLDRMAGEPLAVRVNGRLMATGEIILQGDRLAVRVTHVEKPVAAKGGEGGGI